MDLGLPKKVKVRLPKKAAMENLVAKWANHLIKCAGLSLEVKLNGKYHDRRTVYLNVERVLEGVSLWELARRRVEYKGLTMEAFLANNFINILPETHRQTTIEEWTGT